MMKRPDKIKILGIALVVILAGTFAVTKIQNHAEKIKTGGGTILEIDAGDVDKISWDSEFGSLAFHKDDDGWIYDDDEGFPVDDNSISVLISDFADFEAAFTIEDADDLSQYGLADPACTIKIGTSEKDYEIKLGDYSSMDEQRYVYIGDGNVYLAEYDPYDDFNVELGSLMQNDELPYSFDEDVDASFTGAFEYSFEYVKDNVYTGCSDDKYFTSSKHLALDSEKVSSYLSDLSYIGLGECMTYKASGEELKKYGLDDPEIGVTINYKDSDGEEQTLSFTAGRKAKDRKKDLDEYEDSDDMPDAYFKMEGSTIIYEISGSDLANIMAGSYSDLRHDEIFTSDTEDVKKIVIELEGKSYTFKAKGSGDDKKWYLDGDKVEAGSIVNALASMTAEEYTDSADTDKEEISVTVYMKNKNVSEMSYTFYRNDGETCTAKINGSVECTVSRSDVVDLVEAVNEITL